MDSLQPFLNYLYQLGGDELVSPVNDPDSILGPIAQRKLRKNYINAEDVKNVADNLRARRDEELHSAALNESRQALYYPPSGRYRLQKDPFDPIFSLQHSPDPNTDPFAGPILRRLNRK